MNGWKQGRAARFLGARGRVLAGFLVVALGAAFASGCGGGDDNGGSTAAAQSSSGGGGKRLKIILVGAAPTSEPFSSVAANGLERAGRDFNLATTWRGPRLPNPSDPTEQGRLIENAIAAKPDGLIVSDVFPKQYNPLIKSAIAKGIPVMLFSAGAEQVAATGALAFVGNDETASGELAGQEMKRLGRKHALVISTPPGIPTFDQRVNGFKKGLAPQKVSVLEIPLTDANNTTKIRNLLEIELNKDKSIDSVWPIGTGIGAPVLAAYDRLGDRAKQLRWGQLGVDEPTIKALQAGKYSFTTDQQQFLQGYLPAMWLSLYIRYGIKPVDKFVRTGPALVTTDDAAELARLNAQKIR
jgi:simple sugar transport system substrate-binding protein